MPSRISTGTTEFRWGSCEYRIYPYCQMTIMLSVWKVRIWHVIRNEDERFPSPYRFAVILPVDIGPETSGKWEQAPDGGRIWRVTVTVPGAHATFLPILINLSYPKGERYFFIIPRKPGDWGFYIKKQHGRWLFATELIAGEPVYPGILPSLPVPRVAPLIHIYALIMHTARG